MSELDHYNSYIINEIKLRKGCFRIDMHAKHAGNPGHAIGFYGHPSTKPSSIEMFDPNHGIFKFTMLPFNNLAKVLDAYRDDSYFESFDIIHYIPNTI